jgi:hypothetical protein
VRFRGSLRDKVEKGSLGLAKKGKVNKKEEVINKTINKKAYKL